MIPLEPKDYAQKVKQALSTINFPATKQDIIQKAGNAQVEVAQGRRVSVRDALQPVRQDRFSNPNELLNQINEAHHLDWPRF